MGEEFVLVGGQVLQQGGAQIGAQQAGGCGRVGQGRADHFDVEAFERLGQRQCAGVEGLRVGCGGAFGIVRAG